MTARQKSSDTPSGAQTIAGQIRLVVAPWRTKLRAVLHHLAPYRDRVAGEIGKHPKFVAATEKISGGWTALVESFCAIIDPYLARYFPDVRLVAVVNASGNVELHRIAKGVVAPIGLLASIGPAEKSEIAQAKWTAIELRLRSDQLLQRTISLPAASRDFLAAIIEHRLERLTPWRPDRVLYGYRTLDEADIGGAVSLTLTATSKDFVAGPLRALEEAGLTPTAIGAQEGSLADPIRVNLLRNAAGSVRSDSRRMVSRAALATFAILVTAWLASSLWASNENDAQQAANVRLLKARHLLKAASLGAMGEQERLLLDAKQPDKAVVILIDRLATAIPQDTFLKELAVTPDKVRLVGVSGNAPALIGKLEASGLADVRFTSAVTREKDEKDSFEITARRASTLAAGAP